MAFRRIIWTEAAENEWKNILEFYIFRNKSKTYSTNLNDKTQNELKILLKYPQIGKKTDQLNVRTLLIADHFFFYEITEKDIIVISVQNTKQDSGRLKF